MTLEQDIVSTGSAAFSPEELARARRYSMEILWSNEDGKYIVSVPELPGLHTHGATHREAVAMGEDAIAVWLDGVSEEKLPAPRVFEREYPEYTLRDVLIAAPRQFSPAEIRGLRRRLGVSQRVFAAALNVGLGTLRSWEQGIRNPDGAAVKLLTIAARRPEVVFGPAVATREPDSSTDATNRQMDVGDDPASGNAERRSA